MTSDLRFVHILSIIVTRNAEVAEVENRRDMLVDRRRGVSILGRVAPLALPTTTYPLSVWISRSYGAIPLVVLRTRMSGKLCPEEAVSKFGVVFLGSGTSSALVGMSSQ